MFLYDVSPVICEVWDFLIHCSEADIWAIPDVINADILAAMSDRERTLLGFWIAKGRATPAGVISPWYQQYAGTPDARVWGSAVKTRIIRQKELICGWQVDCASYETIPMREAHWHVDPPYSGPPGRKYQFNRIDFSALAAWVKTLPGSVDVCENEGADWLPFDPLCDVVSARGRRSGAVSREVVWRKI